MQKSHNPNGLPPYHGWVFAYDAATLTQVGSYNATPESAGGGIWQGAGGLAADESGRVYFITGNIQDDVGVDPSPDPRGINLGNSFVRLDPVITRSPDGSVKSAQLEVGSWFVPYRARWQNDVDLDLGSAGPVLITGTTYVAGGGKEGILYLLDRDDLGGFSAAPAAALPPKCAGQPPPGYCAPVIPNDPSFDRALFEVQVGQNQSAPQPTMNDWADWPHVHGSPVLGDFGSTKLLFAWPEKDYLKSISIQGSQLKLEHHGPDLAPARGMPGGMLSLVIDTAHPGQGVLFASVPAEAGGPPQLHGNLHAYDPQTLRRVWTSQESIDRAYWFAKFVGPTVIRDGLLLPTFSNKVLLYGSLSMYDPLAKSHGKLAAIKRSDQQEDIFCVATNGVVYTNFEAGDGAWHGWLPLIDYTGAFPDHFTVPPSSPVAVVKRDDQQEDIFAVGRDGIAYTSFVRIDPATGQWGAWSGWIPL